MAESITVPFTALDLIFLAHLILSISKYRNLCAQSDKMTLFLLKKRGGHINSTYKCSSCVLRAIQEHHCDERDELLRCPVKERCALASGSASEIVSLPAKFPAQGHARPKTDKRFSSRFPMCSAEDVAGPKLAAQCPSLPSPAFSTTSTFSLSFSLSLPPCIYLS